MEKNRSHVSDVLRLSNGRRRRRVSLTNLFPSILFFVVFFFCCVCVLFSFPRPIHANKSPGLESKRFRRTVASRGFFFVFVFFFGNLFISFSFSFILFCPEPRNHSRNTCMKLRSFGGRFLRSDPLPSIPNFSTLRMQSNRNQTSRYSNDRCPFTNKKKATMNHWKRL